MITSPIGESIEVQVVGGKGANLSRLVRAGFPVPGGFVVTTAAFDKARASGGAIPDDIAADIRTAYREMGGGSVAVRSSATAEDMAGASMAGQYETFLDVEGEEELIAAVAKCWASISSDRITAYFAEHGIDRSRVSMAVVVQRLVAADAAGVLFTANPNGGARAMEEMLVEASWGLGESVVSGRVQPDVLTLEGGTGRIINERIADKRVELTAGSHQEHEVSEARRKQACLGGDDVRHLWELGRKAAEHFGAPQDMEWAIREGKLYLLQSRPITTLAEGEAYEEVLRETRKKLRDEISAGPASGRGGPWVLHNLAETLPHPTELTWSVVGRFMSGDGGYGAMYREAGFSPSEKARRDGFLERIAGRIYMDAARAPEMFSEQFGFGYDPAVLRTSIDVSAAAPTAPRGTYAQRGKSLRLLGRVDRQLRELAADYDTKLRSLAFPEMQDYAAGARNANVADLSAEGLIDEWRHHEHAVMDEFAPKSLMPSLISGLALADLRAFLAEHFWDEDADALAQELSSGGAPNRTVVADEELYFVGKGRIRVADWIERHGHRAAGEFDLAAARWRERPAQVLEMAATLAGGGKSPLERHTEHVAAVNLQLESLRQKLSHLDQQELARLLDVARRYMAFREDGKDFLMMGYEHLRRLALDAGRRLGIGEDVFHLTREDLFDALRVNVAPMHLIEKRKRIYKAQARVRLPRMIEAPDIERLGEPPARAATAGGHSAFAVSRGTASGPALIRHSPTGNAPAMKGYILVCPSTDPSWTPLFVNAAGLVLECGGALSHGAVVAREMGLPAVVLPNATEIFQEGQALRVEGDSGWVGPANEERPAAAIADENDTHFSARETPPPAGHFERVSGFVRNIAAMLWAVYLAAFFLLPTPDVEQPTFRFLDAILWPIVRATGRVATVAILAGAIALLTLLVQKFATDNRRLLEAKRRVAKLRKQPLTRGSLRRKAIDALAASVQFRVLMAALVPVGLLLGPMVMPFMWMKDRIDPSVWNAPAGAAVQVVAQIDGNYTGDITLAATPGIALDDSTPATRKLPDIRSTLQHLLNFYQQPASAPTDSKDAWQFSLAPDLGRDATAKDLQAYLARGIPPQPILWTLRPPAAFDGSFTVKAGDRSVTIVEGPSHAPALSLDTGPGLVRSLKVVYPPSAIKPIFWQPLSFLGTHAGKWAAWDAGWVWLYIIAYLPVLLIFRFLLRVA